MSPLVTVLIAVHNGEQTIQETLGQIFSQGFTDYEILVVDDGSSDGTRHILESIRDPRLRVLAHDLNLGLTESLYRGVLEARGSYIARFDDGKDRVSREWLQKCVAPLQEDESIVLCGPRTRSWRGAEFRDSSQPTDSDILRWIFTLQNCVAHAGALFRRMVSGEIQNYNRAFPVAQDYELWSRLARIGRVYVVPELLVDVVYTKDGMSEKKRSEQEAYAAQVRAAQQSWLLDRQDIEPGLANAAAGIYWGWKGISASDHVRGSWLLNCLRRAYMRRFGTSSVSEHLKERWYGLTQWLFHRAEEAGRQSRWHAVQYLMAAWLLDPSQLFSRQSFEAVSRICWTVRTHTLRV